MALSPMVDLPAPVWRRGDPVALTAALALITISALVGRELNERGVPILLPSPPLIALWHPHLGWGTPLALLCVVVGLRLQRLAPGLPRRRLLLAGWLLSLAWMCSLTLIDGLRRGWVNVLLNPNEYLHDLPRITSPATFLATFTDFIAFSAGVDGTKVWTTHVAGHPPLATLMFWGLDRIGLGGGFWAGALCILVGSSIAVALPLTLSELGAGAAARRLVPFIALFPGAVWMAVSADGLFAGVAISGLALVTRGAVRGRLVPAAYGGVLLGTAIFLSYGLVVFGIVVIMVAVITVRRYGLSQSLGPWIAATVGFSAVAAVHLAYGFNWLTGLAQLRIRYYQGVASDRPFSYFVYANLAAWLISCSPLLAIGIGRAVAVLVLCRPYSSRFGGVQVRASQGRRGRAAGSHRDRGERREVRAWASPNTRNRGDRALVRGRRPAYAEDQLVALLALCGVAAAVVADLSGLSKAETERIWLTFGVLTYSSMALLRDRRAAWVLLASAGSALLVNHLFYTGW